MWPAEVVQTLKMGQISTFICCITVPKCLSCMRIGIRNKQQTFLNYTEHPRSSSRSPSWWKLFKTLSNLGFCSGSNNESNRNNFRCCFIFDEKILPYRQYFVNFLIFNRLSNLLFNRKIYRNTFRKVKT